MSGVAAEPLRPHAHAQSLWAAADRQTDGHAYNTPRRSSEYTRRSTSPSLLRKKIYGFLSRDFTNDSNLCSRRLFATGCFERPPPTHHSFESLAGIFILLPVTESVRTPCSRNRTSFWGSGSKFSFPWSDVKKGSPKIYGPNMLYFIYLCGDDFVFPSVLYVFFNIVEGVWRVNLCRGRRFETLTSHRLRLEKELLPGWRPPQPVRARPGRPSENHNWHTGKPFPPPL